MIIDINVLWLWCFGGVCCIVYWCDRRKSDLLIWLLEVHCCKVTIWIAGFSSLKSWFCLLVLGHWWLQSWKGHECKRCRDGGRVSVWRLISFWIYSIWLNLAWVWQDDMIHVCWVFDLMGDIWSSTGDFRSCILCYLDVLSRNWQWTCSWILHLDCLGLSFGNLFGLVSIPCMMILDCSMIWTLIFPCFEWLMWWGL